MRLSNVQVKDVVNQMEAKVVPANHPSAPELERAFGRHTFFLAEEGPHIVSRRERDSAPSDEAYAVRVATWSDNAKSKLMPHPGTIARKVEIGPQSADLGNPDADEPFVSAANANR